MNKDLKIERDYGRNTSGECCVWADQTIWGPDKIVSIEIIPVIDNTYSNEDILLYKIQEEGRYVVIDKKEFDNILDKLKVLE